MKAKKRSTISHIKSVCWRRRFDGLPVWLRHVLENPPLPGEGLHSWLFNTARQLHRHFTPEEICALFAEITEAAGREIQDAVFNSIDSAWQPSRRGGFPRHVSDSTSSAQTVTRARAPQARIVSHPMPQRAWPKPDLEKIEKIVTDGIGLAGLCQQSQYLFNENNPQRYTKWLLGKLFPDNPLLCCGWAVNNFATARLSSWRDLHAGQFIVPNPMTAKMGLTKDQRESSRALSNTGPRRFLPIECDFSMYGRDGRTETVFAPLIRRLARRKITVADMCASLLLHLANYLPLVMALSSGGKSEHGWFSVQGRPEAELRQFMEYAVSLGADHATWSRAQFVRMPDGTRDNGKRQLVHYFDPKFLQSATSDTAGGLK